jgi:DNA-binding SARP family transcriptional activator/TolB-like protein
MASRAAGGPANSRALDGGLCLRTLGGVWVEDAAGARVPSPRPRRIALLLIVGAAGQRGISRNRLRAIFWPDADDEKARHALSQTIYALRRDLGRTLIEGEGDLRLDPTSITSDVQLFREAVARGDLSEAFRLYQGPFGAGFAIDDSPEFERWLEVERVVLEREASAALVRLADDATRSGEHRRAAEVWHRLTDLDPLSGRFAASYMSALAAIGDRAGAVAHARVHTELVRRELDADPDPGVTRLAEQLRSETRVAARAPAEPTAAPVGARTAPLPEPAAPPRPRRSAWLLVGGVAVVAAAVALVLALGRSVDGRDSAPVLAVGQIRDLTAPDSARLGGVMSEVVATSLARLSEIQVIANSRIIELMRPGADTLRSARTDAARRAGATEVIEGELVPAGGGQTRLSLRRVTIDRGAIRAGYSVTGTNRLALVDSITSLIAAELRVGPPVRSLQEFTPRSPIALRLYEEGLRAYYQGETYAAQRLLQEALEEDSTFALAAFYAYRANRALDTPDAELEARALRLASRAPDRERLLIQTSIGQAHHDPAALARADSLIRRYPDDPEALLRAVDAITFHQLIGPRELAILERIIAIDSAAPSNPRAPCRLCEEMTTLMTGLRWADSGAAAERALRRYAALRPADLVAWRELAMQQFYLDRYEAGAALVARLATLPPSGPPWIVSPLFIGRLLTGRYDEADAECSVQLRQTDVRVLESYRWVCVLLWRYQGRYRDASALVIAGRLPDGSAIKLERRRDPLSEAVLDLDMGRPVLALRALESIVPAQGTLPPGRFARELTWSLVRRGTAAVLAGELDLARRLADSAEVTGQESLYGRDPPLHFFLRGLLAAASGDHRTAVDQYRRSIYSPNFGYTRANFELARSLLALGRAPEAVPVLQAALRGGWDGSNLYVSRTELHELLAQAFAAMGSRDSASAHYRRVEEAWVHADPEFAARYQAARVWLGTAPRQ